MTDQSWLKTPPGEALVQDVVSTIVRRYRIDEESAKNIVEEIFSKDEALRKVVEKEKSESKVKRTRAFKEAVAGVKRTIYYSLRRYSVNRDDQRALIAKLSHAEGAPREVIEGLALEIARSHASSRERLAHRDEFYSQLLPLIDSPASILDVGSGMQPLLFPFDQVSGLKLYLAADKDADSVAAVNAFAQASGEGRLTAINWDLRNGWQSIFEASGVSRFDVAFLFKLVPVIERQNPELLDVLLETPARRWVVTGSMISLTKRQRIEKRERAIVRRFCEAANRRVIHEFSVAEEFGIVAEGRIDGKFMEEK